ncbi:MAG TPA: hypothetical protein VFQ53_33495 [Kofleriaceae bacterium]|nr:hypothetical protein [Kofleriaceae bacterium]
MGCAPAKADDVPAPKPPPIRFEHDMMVRFHMHENFDLLRAIEKLLIRGKLDDAKTLARAMANAPDEPGMAAFAAYATRVRERALAVANATTAEDAVRRETELAEACANCHHAASVLPELSEPPRIPPDQPTITARMARHVWATDRIWEGLVIDDDTAWRQGLEVLAATPLPSTTLPADRARDAKQLQRLADRARRAVPTSKLGDRAKDYAEILATCARCHQAAAR